MPKIKDYRKYVEKLKKISPWTVYSCGYPTTDMPVNLYCEWDENPACRMYICYHFRKWQIDYTTDPEVEIRAEMLQTKKVGSDKAMFMQVSEILELFKNTVKTESCEVAAETVGTDL